MLYILILKYNLKNIIVYKSLFHKNEDKEFKEDY